VWDQRSDYSAPSGYPAPPTAAPPARSVSERSRLTTTLLAVFTGVFGGHRFYVGKTGTGILMLCTLGGLGIWYLVDCVMVATGEFRDARGRRVLRWATDEELYGTAADPHVRGDLESLRSNVQELEERVDFLERLLAQVREARGSVPPAGSP